MDWGTVGGRLRRVPGSKFQVPGSTAFVQVFALLCHLRFIVFKPKINGKTLKRQTNQRREVFPNRTIGGLQGTPLNRVLIRYGAISAKINAQPSITNATTGAVAASRSLARFIFQPAVSIKRVTSMPNPLMEGRAASGYRQPPTPPTTAQSA